MNMKRSNSLNRKSSIPIPSALKSRCTLTPNINNDVNTGASNAKRKRSVAEVFGRFSVVSGRSGLTPSKFVTPKPASQLHSQKVQSSVRTSVSSLRSSSGLKHRENLFPLNDISFKTNCITIVQDFLLDNRFGSSISRQILRKPTAREFTNIFNFIYKYIDPSYILPNRFEDEIPKLMKSLRYPVQMKKSTFLNVGSPHSWPTVLAMLVYLINIASVTETIPSPVDDFDNESNFELIFDFVISVFQNKENEQNLLEELSGNMEKLYGVSVNEYESLMLEKEKLMHKISVIGLDKDDVIKEDLIKIQSDKEKMKAFNQDLNAHITIKDAERTELESKLSEIMDEYHEIKETYNELEHKKENQEYSLSEAKKIKEHNIVFENAMKMLRSEEKELNEEKWSQERALSKGRGMFNELCLKYNSQCRHLQLESPSLSSFGMESDAELLQEIADAISVERSKAKNATLQLKNSLTCLENEIAKVEESIKSKKLDVYKSKCKSKRMEEEVESLKEKINTEDTGSQDKCEEMEKKISELGYLLKSVGTNEMRKQLEESASKLESDRKCYADIESQGKALVLEHIQLFKDGKASLDKNEQETQRRILEITKQHEMRVAKLLQD